MTPGLPLSCLTLLAAAHPLATVNASLNALALVLLLVGYWLIKSGREQAHKWVMLSAFATSIVFLGCYLTYHFFILEGGSVKFTGTGLVRPIYFTILITHIILAAAVPVLAILTILHGLRDRRPQHRRLAWWTFPIWVYVSITGVIIYVMLYHIYPA